MRRIFSNNGSACIVHFTPSRNNTDIKGTTRIVTVPAVLIRLQPRTTVTVALLLSIRRALMLVR